MASDFVIPNGTDYLRKPRETSPLSPQRDNTSQLNTWKNIKALAGRVNALATLVQQMNDRIARAERWGTIPFQNPNPFFPFKAYQPSNLIPYIGLTVPMFVTQSDPAYNNGEPIMATVTDQNTPTNLAAIPPAISIADVWRFFCIRTGLVEYRPIYSINGGLDPSGILLNVPGDPNNWGVKFGGLSASVQGTITGTDGLGIWGTGTSFDSQQSSLLPNILAIGSLITPSSPFSVSTWIQITADTASTSVVMNIYGQVNTTIPYSANSFLPGNGPLMLPVAELYFDALLNFIPYQLLFDHVNNRYPGGNGNFSTSINPSVCGIGSVWNSRGIINGNQSPASGEAPDILPNDLGTQLFYPGDIIMVQGYSDGIDTAYPQQAIYQFTGGVPAFLINGGELLSFNYSDVGQTPLDFDSNWTQLFNLPVILLT